MKSARDILKETPHKGTERFALVALSLLAEGGETEPDAERLAKAMGMCTKQILRLLPRLKATGAITTTGGEGRSRLRIRLATDNGDNMSSQEVGTADSGDDLSAQTVPTPVICEDNPLSLSVAGTDCPDNGNGTEVAPCKAETTLPDKEPENQSTTARKRAVVALGTRIPDEFVVTPAMREWASKQAADVDLERETEAFCDYWRGVPGSRGRKLDWPATWRNRMRDLQGKIGGRNGTRGRQPDGGGGAAARAPTGNGYNPWGASKRV